MERNNRESTAIVISAVLIAVGFLTLACGAVIAEQAKARAVDRMADTYETAMSEYRDSLDRRPTWVWQGGQDSEGGW
jgi:hypothetical protein